MWNDLFFGVWWWWWWGRGAEASSRMFSGWGRGWGLCVSGGEGGWLVSKFLGVCVWGGEWGVGLGGVFLMHTRTTPTDTHIYTHPRTHLEVAKDNVVGVEIHTDTHTDTSIHIHIYRQRERDIQNSIQYPHIHPYIYIHPRTHLQVAEDDVVGVEVL